MDLKSSVCGHQWSSKIVTTFLGSFALLSVASAGTVLTRRLCTPNHRRPAEVIYDYEIASIYGDSVIDWSQYRDKVVLIVNVASFSENTYQYLDLNALQSTYEDFMVLGVPCNQFAFHEPGANATEIYNCLCYVRPGNGYTPNFELTWKATINGGMENEHPLFTYLKDRCPPPTMAFARKEVLEYDLFRSGDVKWDFEKWLIDRNGMPIYRYSNNTQPLELEDDILSLLAA